MIAAYYRRLTHPDRDVQIAAARAWSVWEGSTLSLVQDPERVQAVRGRHLRHRLRAHRVPLLRQPRLLRARRPAAAPAWTRIRHLPCVMVHGRYDVVTPVKNAWDLYRAWPQAELRIVADAGHAMTEPGIVHELVGATRKFAAAATGRH